MKIPVSSRGALAPIVIMASLMAACGAPKTAEAPPTAPAEPAQSQPAAHAAGPHWSYEGESGPAAWGGLSEAFAACSAGQAQSPIDLGGAKAEALPAVETRYGRASLRIVHHEHVADVVNTGHSIQVNVPGADTLTVEGKSFPLAQYHFHSPSEHTVDGKHSAMEMHLVHKADDGALAVVGVLIEEGPGNAAFDPIWANLPAQKSAEVHLEHVTVDIDQLLPANRSTYRYEGSLTTPPCTEGVKWFVMKTPIHMSAEQIGRFRQILQGNNRPVQPLNGRVLVTETVP